MGSLITTTLSMGQPGAPGKSAYELAVAAGYQGTEAEWLALVEPALGEVRYSIEKPPGDGWMRANGALQTRLEWPQFEKLRPMPALVVDFIPIFPGTWWGWSSHYTPMNPGNGGFKWGVGWSTSQPWGNEFRQHFWKRDPTLTRNEYLGSIEIPFYGGGSYCYPHQIILPFGPDGFAAVQNPNWKPYDVVTYYGLGDSPSAVWFNLQFEEDGTIVYNSQSSGALPPVPIPSRFVSSDAYYATWERPVPYITTTNGILPVPGTSVAYDVKNFFVQETEGFVGAFSHNEGNYGQQDAGEWTVPLYNEITSSSDEGPERGYMAGPWVVGWVETYGSGGYTYVRTRETGKPGQPATLKRIEHSEYIDDVFVMTALELRAGADPWVEIDNEALDRYYWGPVRMAPGFKPVGGFSLGKAIYVFDEENRIGWLNEAPEVPEIEHTDFVSYGGPILGNSNFFWPPTDPSSVGDEVQEPNGPARYAAYGNTSRLRFQAHKGYFTAPAVPDQAGVPAWVWAGRRRVYRPLKVAGKALAVGNGKYLRTSEPVRDPLLAAPGKLLLTGTGKFLFV